ncbi:MAG TPA: potassium transporter TrkG [Anaerolineae bacterium]|nr:potassium transporter TrkG [Anaerolineae bacterium]
MKLPEPYEIWQKVVVLLTGATDFFERLPYRRRLHVAVRIVLGLVVLIVVGTVLLTLPGMSTGERLPLLDAFFIATSALTVTGLSVITVGVDLTPVGQWVLLFLIQVGGVGYMFLASITLLLIGRRISLVHRLTLSSSLGLDKPQEIVSILRRTFIGIVAIELGGAVAFYVHWELNGIVSERTLFFAIFHSISAFCNAGFDLFGGLAAYPEGIPSDNVSLVIMGSLIVLGGLGIPVLSEILLGKRGRHYSVHTQITLRMAMILTVVGWVGLYVSEGMGAGVLAEAPLGERLVRTWFQSISNRTAGFAGLPQFEALSPASVLLIMVLMFIGCAPASMGGGITTGTLAVLMLALRGYTQGVSYTKFGMRRIAVGTVRRAGVVLTVGLMVVVLATWLLLLTQPSLKLSEAMFEVVSAFATCGLSLGVTTELNTFGRLVIVVMMFWGRLGALTLVTALMQSGPEESLVQYAEEGILIG